MKLKSTLCKVLLLAFRVWVISILRDHFPLYFRRYVRVQNVTSLAARTSMGQSNAVIDSVLVEVGQPGGDVHGENVVYLEMGVDWISPRSKVT